MEKGVISNTYEKTPFSLLEAALLKRVKGKKMSPH
jgi:hypothetical protein